MTSYKYETHLHTAETSRCAIHSGAEMVRHYVRHGYTGLFVTDHFLNGNTAVADTLTWSERIQEFCRGYEVAAAEGSRLGLDVFLGWEYSHGWAHFLTYGLDKAWLLSHPDLLAWDLPEYCDRVHEDGGAIIHAHPFREGIDYVPLVPSKTDAVEVINACRTDEANRHALDYARSFRLPETAGSDIHSINQVRLSGVGSPRRLEDGRDYLSLLRAGRLALFDTPGR